MVETVVFDHLVDWAWVGGSGAVGAFTGEGDFDGGVGGVGGGGWCGGGEIVGGEEKEVVGEVEEGGEGRECGGVWWNVFDEGVAGAGGCAFELGTCFWDKCCCHYYNG